MSASGEERRYRKLVATIPVNFLFDAFDDVPAEVLEAARALRFNSLRVALVGVSVTTLPAYTALYVPDPASLYHRVCYNQVFSPDMVPSGCSSVSCEITVAPGSEVDAWSDEKVMDRVVDDLARDAIVDPKTIVYRTVHREKYAYVVYDLGYSKRVGIVRDYVEKRGIHLAGRFAEYRYVNTDACVRRALDLSRQLRGGDIAPEASRSWPMIAPWVNVPGGSRTSSCRAPSGARARCSTSAAGRGQNGEVARAPRARTSRASSDGPRRSRRPAPLDEVIEGDVETDDPAEGPRRVEVRPRPLRRRPRAHPRPARGDAALSPLRGRRRPRHRLAPQRRGVDGPPRAARRQLRVRAERHPGRDAPALLHARQRDPPRRERGARAALGGPQPPRRPLGARRRPQGPPPRRRLGGSRRAA